MKRIAIYLIVFAFTSCTKENQAPECAITNPENNSTFVIDDVISVSVEASDPDGFIHEVQLYIDGVGITSLKEFPYTYEIEAIDYGPGEYAVKAIAFDEEGLNTSDEISITIEAVLATLTTNPVSSITDSSAISGGNITSDGGAEITSRGVCWSTSSNPTISDNHTSDGNGLGEFASSIAGLDPNTTYHIKAYATNSAGTSYGDVVIFTTLNSVEAVSDYDGNIYQTVQIGEQIWMAENLKTTHYANGSVIPLVENASSWEMLTAEDKAYCWYNYNSSNGENYGALYSWAAAMNGAASSNNNPSGVQGVCPDGWHLPSDEEWIQLELRLGMSQTDANLEGWSRGPGIGGKLKAEGITHWLNPNTGATNESGFTALPGGYGIANGTFGGIHMYSSWWTSSEHTTLIAWDRGLGYDNANAYRDSDLKDRGYSIRCVKD